MLSPNWTISNPTSPGVPVSRVVTPMVMVNGMEQQMTVGMKIPACFLPDPSLSGTPANVQFAAGGAPAVVDTSLIPTTHFGTSTNYLGTPVTWLQVVGTDGVTYMVPAYNPIN